MPTRSKSRRKRRIEEKAEEETNKKIATGALQAAADKLNLQKKENGGRVPYGAMPKAIASLAFFNIKATPKKLICLMEKRIADCPPVVNVTTEETSALSSLTNRASEEFIQQNGEQQEQGQMNQKTYKIVVELKVV